MKLVLGVDFVGPPLQLDGEIPNTSWPVQLEDSLLQEVVRWNDDFISIIVNESAPDHGLRKSELNAAGSELANRIGLVLGGAYKVRYRGE